MTTNKCPQCNLVNFSNALICKRCDANLTQSVVEEVIHQPEQKTVEPHEQLRFVEPQFATSTETRKTSFGDGFSAVLWAFFIPYLAADFLFLLIMLGGSNGAPQEAAGAALAAAFAIIPYCFLRAVSEINSLSKNR